MAKVLTKRQLVSALYVHVADGKWGGRPGYRESIRKVAKAIEEDAPDAAVLFASVLASSNRNIVLELLGELDALKPERES